MTFGIDVDGCLADFNHDYIKRIIAVTHRDLFPPRPFDITTWYYPESYGYITEEVSKTWETIKTDPTFWQSLTPYEYTLDVLAELDRLSQRHAVYFITARPGVRAKQQTELWLKRLGYWTPTVIVTQGDPATKGIIAKALEFDVFIDDKIENVEAVMSVGLSARLFSQPWNRHASSHIPRLYEPLADYLHTFATL